MGWKFFNSSGQVLTEPEIADNSITLAKMAANSVDSDQYVDGSIDNVHLADNAVNSDELAAGAVDIAHLSASGTASNSTFLRGDNTWQAVSGGSITDLNGEAENRIPTFGSTTTELDGSANLTFNGATLVVTHTSSGNAIEVKSTGTNSNAQARITNDVRSWDFSVRGDASDSLFITDVGAGDLSGLENRIKIATGGEVTMPAQPAFQTKQDSGANNVTGDGSAWTFGADDNVTDRFDIGSNVSSTAVFTAPVTGTYVLTAHITVVNAGIDSSHDNYMVTILTSNRSYDTFAGLYAMRAASGNIGATMVKDTVIADMDAGDTAVIKFYVYDGSKTVDINSGNNTYFAGYLVG